LTKPRDYGDGGGLYLQVKPSGRKSWVFRYKIAGRIRWMGLGAYPEAGLADARKRAEDARKLTNNRIDPLVARQSETEAAARAVAETEAAVKAEAQAALRTFRNAAAAYIAAHEAGWRNAKHHQQWGNTLATYAFPSIGDLSIAVLDTDHVLGVLEPIWRT